MARQLLLERMTVEALDAAMADVARLGEALKAGVAPGWEGFPEALPVLRKAEAERPSPSRFGSYFFVLDEPRTLVGMGGFKGEPNDDGSVEIGYAIAPSFQNQGLATRAVEDLKARAFADGRVRAILAHTLPVRTPSSRVLEKTGFAMLAERQDPEVGAVWLWCLDRARPEP